MKPRTQQEILDRIIDAQMRGDQGDETHEYMRCARFIPLSLRSIYQDTTEDDWYFIVERECVDYIVAFETPASIDETAKRYLSTFERLVRRSDGYRITKAIAMYQAWKWLLGHRDSDSFMVSDCPSHFHLTPVEIYAKLMVQMLHGEWDRMSKERERYEVKQHNAKAPHTASFDIATRRGSFKGSIEIKAA